MIILLYVCFKFQDQLYCKDITNTKQSKTKRLTLNILNIHRSGGNDIRTPCTGHSTSTITNSQPVLRRFSTFFFFLILLKEISASIMNTLFFIVIMFWLDNLRNSLLRFPIFSLYHIYYILSHIFSWQQTLSSFKVLG